MSITSSRVIQIQFSGDISTQIIQSALDNDVSPCQIDYDVLDPGDNVISTPATSGIVITGLTIIPPVANTSLLTLAGIPLHLTDPTSLALDTTFVSLVLNAAAAIVGVRLIWS